MSKTWLVLIAFSIVASASMVLFYQPAISESQTQVLLDESIALSDQLSTKQRLSVMLDESILLDDQIKATNP